MIRGFFQPESAASPAPLVLAAVQLPGITPWKLMPFLIDTGATRTVIHPQDATELLLIGRDRLLRPSNDWGVPRAAGGIGEGARYFEIRGSLGFSTVDGAPDIVDLTFGLAVPTQANASIPSLLGWDVLRHFDVRINWAAGIVQLDRVS